jgi:hypothetical protein
MEPAAPAPSKGLCQMKIAGHEPPDVKQKQQKAAVMVIDVNADHQSIVVNAPAAELTPLKI